mmetsp:Transcript_3327/g.11006  ORF Transcript_3327/g.11006 Transcript_3327/m.11006 type:complete len:227 (+) Transcript_3327:301-981(+)
MCVRLVARRPGQQVGRPARVGARVPAHVRGPHGPAHLAGPPVRRVGVPRRCLGRMDVALDLACLPVFLASSRRFVALAGPTYFERLWCVLELFLFLQCGGSPEQVDIIPAAASPAHLRAQAGRFDVRTARCTVPGDKERMLMIIDASWGSIDAFNASVRALLLRALDRVDDAPGGQGNHALSWLPGYSAVRQVAGALALAPGAGAHPGPHRITAMPTAAAPSPAAP